MSPKALIWPNGFKADAVEQKQELPSSGRQGNRGTETESSLPMVSEGWEGAENPDVHFLA